MHNPEKNIFAMHALKARLESRKDRRFEQQIEEQRLDKLKKQLQTLVANNKKDPVRVA